MSQTNQKTPEEIQADKDAKAAAAKKGKKARVLVDTTIGDTDYKANDVAELTDAEIESFASALDTTPAAVKYAESLKKKPAED